MEEKPLVSIVIPAYNRAATIADCLRSVQSQTYQNWEAVVVDDGSTDGTAACIEQMAREDARIRLIRHQRNRGAQAARNTGIRAAQGEWIAFLDSDDQYLPHSLEARLELAAKEKVSVVHSECYVIKVDGVKRLHGVQPMAGRVYRKLLEREGPMFQGLLVSRDAMNRIGCLDERIVAFQEWDTSIRLAKYYSFGFEPEPTFIYDERNPDTISKVRGHNGKGYEQVAQKHWLAILRHVGPRTLAQHYRRATHWYQAVGDRKSLRRCRLKAFVCLALDPKTVLQKLRSCL
jgi:glycosyltransferase involved in cell wall biosynthesis